MGLQIYKPNRNTTGSAANFEVSPNDKGEPVLWISATRQKSWDGKSGTFYKSKDDKVNTVNAKFNRQEAEGIAQALMTGCETSDKKVFSRYHTSTLGSLTLSLAYSEKEWNGKVMRGFFMDITRNGSDKFKLSILREDEAPMIANYIRSLIDQITKDAYIKYRDYQKPVTQAPAPAQETTPAPAAAQQNNLEESPF